jgi:hypothetical protein
MAEDESVTPAPPVPINIAPAAPPAAQSPEADDPGARDREAVSALIGPVADHFQEAVDSGEVLLVAVTVIRNASFSQTVPFWSRAREEPPSPEDEARRAHAIYLAANHFGKTHALYSARTMENLRRSVRQPAD